MISSSTLRMLALAVLGLLVAAAVAVLASQLASRQIGLASEPVSAGDELAPAVVHRGSDDKGGGHDKTTQEAGPGSGEAPSNPQAPSSANGSSGAEEGSAETREEAEAEAAAGGDD